MKNKKLLLVSLLSLSMICVSCTPSSSSSSSSEAKSESSTTTSSTTSSESTSSEEKYTSISDVSKLFKTYNSKSEFNFSLTYTVSTVTNRQHVGTLVTDYQYQDNKIQITYEEDGEFYTDYFHEDEATNTYEYYIDMGGQKEYQLIDGENEYYFQFSSAIDKLDLSNIDWADTFLVNEEKKTLNPIDSACLTEVAKHIFGDRANEYWEKLVINYDGGFISKINAISIYRESVYYYSIVFADQDWVNIELPTTTQDYVGNQPYYKNEEYTGVALTEEQASAIEFLENSHDANYSVSCLWEQVILGSMTGATVHTSSKYADGNAEYRYTNATTNITYTDYLVDSGNGQFTYYQDNADGTHTPNLSGTEEYNNAVANFALDQLNLASLDASDFIYNAEKGYIMPKDKATEQKLVGSIFGFSDYYYGLHIYLENNVISKLETSLYIESGTSIASYKKTYTLTSIGTTTINYPNDIII